MLPTNWPKLMVLGIIKENYKAVLLGIAVAYLVSILIHTLGIWGEYQQWCDVTHEYKRHLGNMLIPGWLGIPSIVIGACVGWWRYEVWDWIRDWFRSFNY